MSVDSISSYDYTSSLYSIMGIGQTQSTPPPLPPDMTGSQSSDTSQISQGGQFMQQLSSLQKTDPDKFKEVAQKISDDLAAQAEESTDSQKSQMLSDLSQKFASAAESGEMPDLRPPDNGGGQGGFSLGGTSGSSSNSSLIMGGMRLGGSGGSGSGGLLGELSQLFASDLASVTGSSTSTTTSTTGA